MFFLLSNTGTLSTDNFTIQFKSFGKPKENI